MPEAPTAADSVPAAPVIAAPPAVPAFKPDIFHKAPEPVDVDSLIISDDEDLSVKEAPATPGLTSKTAGDSFFSNKTPAGRLASGTSVGATPDHIPQLPEVPVHGAPHIDHSVGFSPEEVNSSETIEAVVGAHTPPAPPAEVVEAPAPEAFLPPEIPADPVPGPEPVFLPTIPIPVLPPVVEPELPPVPVAAEIPAPATAPAVIPAPAPASTPVFVPVAAAPAPLPAPVVPIAPVPTALVAAPAPAPVATPVREVQLSQPTAKEEIALPPIPDFPGIAALPPVTPAAQAAPTPGPAPVGAPAVTPPPVTPIVQAAPAGVVAMPVTIATIATPPQVVAVPEAPLPPVPAPVVEAKAPVAIKVTYFPAPVTEETRSAPPPIVEARRIGTESGIPAVQQAPVEIPVPVLIAAPVVAAAAVVETMPEVLPDPPAAFEMPLPPIEEPAAVVPEPPVFSSPEAEPLPAPVFAEPTEIETAPAVAEISVPEIPPAPAVLPESIATVPVAEIADLSSQPQEVALISSLPELPVVEPEVAALEMPLPPALTETSAVPPQPEITETVIAASEVARFESAPLPAADEPPSDDASAFLLPPPPLEVELPSLEPQPVDAPFEAQTLTIEVPALPEVPQPESAPAVELAELPAFPEVPALPEVTEFDATQLPPPAFEAETAAPSFGAVDAPYPFIAPEPPAFEAPAFPELPPAPEEPAYAYAAEASPIPEPPAFTPEFLPPTLDQQGFAPNTGETYASGPSDIPEAPEAGLLPPPTFDAAPEYPAFPALPPALEHESAALPPPPAFDAPYGEPNGEQPVADTFPPLPPAPEFAHADLAYMPAVPPQDAPGLPPLPAFPSEEIPGLPPLPSEMGVVPPDPLQPEEQSPRNTLRGNEPARITRLSRKPEQLLTRRKSKTLTGNTSFGRLVDPETGEPLPETQAAAGVVAPSPFDPPDTRGTPFTRRTLADAPNKMAAPRDLAGSRKPRTPRADDEESKPRTFGQALLWLVPRIIVVSLLASGALPLYLWSVNYLKETRVDGIIITPPDTAKVTEFFIVDDFRGEIADVRARLRAERQPLMERMQQRVDAIANIKREMEAKEDQVQRWLQEIEAKRKELKDLQTDVVRRRKEIWDGPGNNLSDQYNRNQTALRQEIEARARALNLANFKGTQEYPLPDVWINAFSVALYDAPKSINVAQEKEWAQKKLKEWHDYVDSYNKQTADFTDRMKEIESVVGPKAAEVNQQTEELTAKIKETNQTIGPLKDEMAKVEVDLQADRSEEASLDQRFLIELADIPKRKQKRTVPLVDNRFSLRHLERKETGRANEWEPGTYWAFVRIRVASEEYWAMGTISVDEYRARQIIVPPSAFEPILQILKAEADSDPMR
ncbi:MAG: hypothetical protein ACAI35_20185 [Candidatus Methylacidiphilales bacterium]